MMGCISPESIAFCVLSNRLGTRFISSLWSPKIVSPAHMSTVVYSPGCEGCSSCCVRNANVCSVSSLCVSFKSSSDKGLSRFFRRYSYAWKWSSISNASRESFSLGYHTQSFFLEGTCFIHRKSCSPSIAQLWAENRISLYSIKSCLQNLSDTIFFVLRNEVVVLSYLVFEHSGLFFTKVKKVCVLTYYIRKFANGSPGIPEC